MVNGDLSSVKRTLNGVIICYFVMYDDDGGLVSDTEKQVTCCSETRVGMRNEVTPLTSAPQKAFSKIVGSPKIMGVGDHDFIFQWRPAIALSHSLTNLLSAVLALVLDLATSPSPSLALSPSP